MLKKQRIVITGGNGFLGSFLIGKLLERGYKNICVLSQSKERPFPEITYIVCDLEKDEIAIKNSIKKNDIVVHLACSTAPSTSENDRTKDVRSNIIGTLTLLETCVAKKIKKFIFASSGGAVYGHDSRKNFTETDSLEPKNSYGAMKVALEKYIGVFSHLYGMNHAILRLSNLYGRKIPSGLQNGAVDIFTARAKSGEKINIWGNGETVRDYIHVSDAVDFFILAIEKEEISGTFNVGTGIGTTLNEIVEGIKIATGKKLRISYHKARSVDVKYSVLDISKAKTTGWRPKLTIREGIKKCLL